MTTATLPSKDQLPKITPDYFDMHERVEANCYHLQEGINWYAPVMLNADSIRHQLMTPHYVEQAIKLYENLTPDEYIKYLISYYKEGLKRFGDKWRYADIVTVLLSLSEILKPTSYLEIGVRRGRSACAVASRTPACNFYLFDMWKNKNYAGMDNPGHEFVEEELPRLGHTGTREFILGNSHQTLKEFFGKNPEKGLDIITVDGDHTFDGAVEDLCDVLPHVKIGGAVVFDDLCHPKHLHLRQVWKCLVEDDQRFSTCSIDDVGYGVGFAIRLW